MAEAAEREEIRRWLERGIDHDSAGWESLYVELYGWEGAIDLLVLQDARLTDVNLSHKPFASNAELKYAVYDAREAIAKVQHLAYEVGLGGVRAARAAREAAELAELAPVLEALEEKANG